MNKYETHKETFSNIARFLANSENAIDKIAYRICWKKPYKFYTDFTKCLETLRTEAQAQL